MDWLHVRLSTRLNFSAELTQTLYSKIARIDAIKGSLALTNVLLPQTLERLTQSVIVTSTGASNRIEGNQLSDEQVDALYRSMRIKSFSSRDEQEVAGYLQVLQTVFEHYQDMAISESTIRHVHHQMLSFSDKDQGHKGHYKRSLNRVEAHNPQGQVMGIIFDPTPPHLTPKEMQELVAWYHWAQQHSFKHPLILLANFLFEFLAIHPFQDGNGRTSRLLTNLILLQQGYSHASLVSGEKIIENSKAQYYLALNQTQQSWKSDTEDMTPWCLYIFDIFHQQALSAEQIVQQDQFEYLLSDKQLAFWQWAQRQGEFSRKMAIEALNFPPRTVESITKKLLDMKKLERLGQGRAIRYRVIAVASGSK